MFIQLYNITNSLKMIFTFRIWVVLFVKCTIFFKQRKSKFTGGKKGRLNVYQSLCLSTECYNHRKIKSYHEPTTMLSWQQLHPSQGKKGNNTSQSLKNSLSLLQDWWKRHRIPLQIDFVGYHHCVSLSKEKFHTQWRWQRAWMCDLPSSM